MKELMKLNEFGHTPIHNSTWEMIPMSVHIQLGFLPFSCLILVFRLLEALSVLIITPLLSEKNPIIKDKLIFSLALYHVNPGLFGFYCYSIIFCSLFLKERITS